MRRRRNAKNAKNNAGEIIAIAAAVFAGAVFALTRHFTRPKVQ